MYVYIHISSDSLEILLHIAKRVSARVARVIGLRSGLSVPKYDGVQIKRIFYNAGGRSSCP